MDLDRFDARLLVEIQRSTRTPTEELAKRVGLSLSAVQRRLKTLRAEGVIQSEVAIVNPKAVGQNVAMVVLVGLERERPDILDRFSEAIRKSPNVMAGYVVTGDADFVLIVTVEDVDQYDAFTRSFFHANPDIKWFRTLVVLRNVKQGFELPIDVERFRKT